MRPIDHAKRRAAVFCDVDGTLLLWPGKPGMPGESEYSEARVNLPLVRELTAMDADIYVWSTGGIEHARAACEMCAPHGLRATPLPKPSLVIDDATSQLLWSKIAHKQISAGHYLESLKAVAK